MRIDGVPWKQWVWIAVKAVAFGGLVGAAAGGIVERVGAWVLRP